MPLQFYCQACGQPIEVDDEAANQQVVCPFCKNIGQAPATTDMTIQFDVQEAQPLTVAHQAASIVSVSPDPRRPASGAQLGWMALALAGLSMLCIVIILITLAPIAVQLDPNSDMAEMQQLLQTKMEDSRWLLILYALGWLIAPLAGIILAITALVKRSTPRWPAVVALCVFGPILFLICMGTIMGMVMG